MFGRLDLDTPAWPKSFKLDRRGLNKRVAATCLQWTEHVREESIQQ